MRPELAKSLARLDLVSDHVEQEHAALRPRPEQGPMPKELLPAAVHYLRARRAGMSAEAYARQFPQTFEKLWRAMGGE